MKNLFLFVTIVFCVTTGCHLLPSTGSVLMDVPDIIAEDAGSLVAEDTIALDGPTDKPGVFIIPPVLVHPLYFYPPGPYAVEKFQVMPNMTFYDPWEDKWIELKDYYLSEDVKALFIVSSAGWCGPCFAEAASLASVYEKYNSDGLEIIYTLGNTNIPGDVPFETSYDKPDSADFAADLKFMENWKLSAGLEAGQPINYPMYADPRREFLPYAPNHAWPFSMLVTTKDMGIRLVEEGFWSVLVENKIEMVLFNEVPDIPFE